MEVANIARVCHEANRALCLAQGDTSQPLWEDAPDWQKDSAVSGVEFCLANPDAGPDASHKNWLKDKKVAGWMYGPVKDPEAKTHPCMVAFGTLPMPQQMKDVLFSTIVAVLRHHD